MTDAPADPKAPGLGTAGALAEVLELAGCRDLAELADVLEGCDLPLRKVFDHVRTIEVEGGCTLAEAAVHVESLGDLAQHRADLDKIRGSANVDDLDDLQSLLDDLRKHVDSLSEAEGVIERLAKIVGVDDEALCRVEDALCDEFTDAIEDEFGHRNVGAAIGRAFHRAKLLICPDDPKGVARQLADLPDVLARPR